MDTAQIEQELEDLEARMERLRSLYEQYFLGLEKLEPAVLRKDVDRKLWVLRREKIRNTGMRFKFQMLIQRYNTYQQYWTRVVREIENGTYRRDILKVAQRFGDKEAMTILGKKRAEQYQRLAKNQLDRRNKRKGVAESEPPPVIETDEAPISLAGDDVELIDDERETNELPIATPAPPRIVPPVRPAPRVEPDMESLLMFATVGVTTWDERPPAPAPPSKPASRPPSKPATKPPPRPATKPPARPAASPPPAAASPPPAAASPPPAAPSPPPAAPAPTSTPISAPKTSSPAVSSGKSRVAELAAQMRAKKQKAPRPAAADVELDNLFEPKPPAPAAPPAAKPAATAATPPAPAKPAPAKPAAAADPRPPARPSAPAAQPPTASPFPKARALAAPLTSAAAKAAPPPEPAPKPSRADDMNEQKLREIYARYVGAKRAANESTAGITFDKLVTSLRAQADKLKNTHPTKSVDFEVVVKDGKTALRPILK